MSFPDVVVEEAEGLILLMTTSRMKMLTKTLRKMILMTALGTKILKTKLVDDDLADFLEN